MDWKGDFTTEEEKGACLDLMDILECALDHFQKEQQDFGIYGDIDMTRLKL